MPEGPEVQTVVSILERQLKHSVIQKVEVFYPKILENDNEEGWNRKLKGQSLLEFNRIGKYIILSTEEYDLVMHLRMEGKFYIYEQLPDSLKHIHVIFYLEDGRKVCYHDTRKFGRMNIYDKVEDKSTLPALKNVGYDALDERVTGAYFYQSIHDRKVNLKTCLLDQSIMAGIGNIYADEICFASGLDPRSRSHRISKQDCEQIVYHTKRILNGAIRYGGTTIRSYTSSLGVTGLFQLKLKVHTLEQCPVCQSKIIKKKVSTRGTYICVKCQKRK